MTISHHQSCKGHGKIRKDLSPSRPGSSGRHLLISALDTQRNFRLALTGISRHFLALPVSISSHRTTHPYSSIICM